LVSPFWQAMTVAKLTHVDGVGRAWDASTITVASGATEMVIKVIAIIAVEDSAVARTITTMEGIRSLIIMVEVSMGEV